jgi:hypothetical protein
MFEQLRSFVQKVLLEGRIDDLEARFPDVDVAYLATIDPTPQKKYIEWIVKQINGDSTNHNLQRVKNLITLFHKNNQRFQNKDIYSYNTVDELENVVNDVIAKKTSKERRFEKKRGSDTIYEDNEITVVFIGSRESCQIYGAGSKWCITMKDMMYYEHYNAENTVFYFVLRKQPKKDDFDKIALSVERDHDNNVTAVFYYDEKDIITDLGEISEHISNIRVINRIIVSDAAVKAKTLYAKLNDGETSRDEELSIIKSVPDVARFASKFSDPKIISMLANDDNDWVKLNLAENPKAPSEVLDALSRNNSENQDIQCAIIENPNTSPETLDRLSLSDDVSIVNFVSKRRQLNK